MFSYQVSSGWWWCTMVPSGAHNGCTICGIGATCELFSWRTPSGRRLPAPVARPSPPDSHVLLPGTMALGTHNPGTADHVWRLDARPHALTWGRAQPMPRRQGEHLTILSICSISFSCSLWSCLSNLSFLVSFQALKIRWCVDYKCMGFLLPCLPLWCSSGTRWMALSLKVIW
jgi:hypothetical protein